MMERSKTKTIFSNTLYTIGGALVLNGVLQLLVYPRLAAHLGAEANGTVLFIMALVNILGPSIGQALNNSRLVLRRDYPVQNGDYNILILLLSSAGIVVSLIMTASSQNGAAGFLLTGILILLTNFRYYGDVEYRLSLDYRSYFVYYLLCGAGYAAGYGIYLLTGNWYVIFIAGEAAALLFVWKCGSIFKPFLNRSAYFKEVSTKGTTLVLSYLITNVALNYDRIFLKAAYGGTEVTEFYVASLIGKTLVLFIAPINTILISYLTKENVRLDRKRFLRFAAAGAGASVFFFLLCQIGTPLFVRLFYPALYDAVKPMITIVNLIQILAMLSAYLFIVVLTFTGAKWQLLLQGGHLILTVFLTAVVFREGGILAFAKGLLIANALRIAAVMLLGIVFAGKKEEETL